MGKLNAIVVLIKKIAPYVVVSAVVSVLCIALADPISRNDSHEWRMWLAAFGVAMILVRLLKPLLEKTTRLKQWAVRVYLAALVTACTFGVFNYYQFDNRVWSGMDDYTDIAYYYLNTKYLDELGYFSLYAAMITADREYKDHHSSKIRRYRDLRDYEVKGTQVAYEHGKQIKQRFTKARWEEFKHDVNWFLARKSTRNMQANFYVDHGYNPPPTWAVPGGGLAQIAPVESIKLIALVDVVFVSCALLGVAWAFGAETMLYAMLFFLFTFSGRWPILSHSLLRFDWSSMLVLSVCMLKKGKFGIAGAFMGYAALNRIFPAIFFFPWVVVAVLDIIKERRLPMRHVKFTAGAALMTALLVGGALAEYGPETFQQSMHNLLMHNVSYSSHRVGLGDMLMFKGETSRAEINANGGIHKKEVAIQAMQPMLRLIGALTLLFIAFFIYRRRDFPLHKLIHFAVIPFFCVTNPQINYYNLRLILVMWHASHLDKPFHKVGLSILCIIEVVAHYIQIERMARYTVTTSTSIGLFIYILLLMGYMGFFIVKSYGVFDKKTPADPGPTGDADESDPSDASTDDDEGAAEAPAPETGTSEEDDDTSKDK